MKGFTTHFSSIRQHTELGSFPEWEIKLRASPKMHVCLLQTTQLNESPRKQKAKGRKSPEIILYKRRMFSGKLLNVAL